MCQTTSRSLKINVKKYEPDSKIEFNDSDVIREFNSFIKFDITAFDKGEGKHEHRETAQERKVIVVKLMKDRFIFMMFY